MTIACSFSMLDLNTYPQTLNAKNICYFASSSSIMGSICHYLLTMIVIFLRGNTNTINHNTNNKSNSRPLWLYLSHILILSFSLSLSHTFSFVLTSLQFLSIKLIRSFILTPSISIKIFHNQSEPCLFEQMVLFD